MNLVDLSRLLREDADHTRREIERRMLRAEPSEILYYLARRVGQDIHLAEAARELRFNETAGLAGAFKSLKIPEGFELIRVRRSVWRLERKSTDLEGETT